MKRSRAGEVDNAPHCNQQGGARKTCANNPQAPVNSLQRPAPLNNVHQGPCNPAGFQGRQRNQHSHQRPQNGSAHDDFNSFPRMLAPTTEDSADILNPVQTNFVNSEMGPILHMLEIDSNMSWRRRAQSTEEGVVANRESEEHRKRPIQINGFTESSRGDECGNCVCKRRTRSEGDEGGVASVWKTLEDGPILICPWELRNGADDASSREDSPMQNASNDMEGYFQDNAGMLAQLDMARQNHVQEKDSSEDSGKDDEEDDDDDEDEVEGARALVLPVRTNLSTSYEDQGDFIETDISLQQLGGSSYANSCESSTEDLPRTINVDCPACAANFVVRRGHWHYNHHGNGSLENNSLLPHHHSCNRGICDGREADRPHSIASLNQDTEHIHSEVFQYLRHDNRSGTNQENSTSSSHEQKGQEADGGTAASHSSSHYSPELDIEYMDFDLDASQLHSIDSSNSSSSQLQMGPPVMPIPSAAAGAQCNDGAVANRDRNSDSSLNQRRDSGVDEEQTSEPTRCYCGTANISFSSSSTSASNCCNSSSRTYTSHVLLGEGHNLLEGAVGLYNGTGARPRVPHHSNTLHTHANSLERTSSDEGAADMDQDVDLLHEPNNLDLEGPGSSHVSDHEDLLNVSRQTSTSNFDQDENSFQGDDENEEITMDSADDAHENRCSGACGGDEDKDGNSDSVYDIFLHNVKTGLYSRFENNNYKHTVKPYRKAKLQSDLDLATPNRVDSLEHSPRRGVLVSQANVSEDDAVAGPSSSNDDLAGAGGAAHSGIRPTNWPEGSASPSRSRNSNTWPQCSDDESPVSALRLLEYEFTDEVDWRRQR